MGENDKHNLKTNNMRRVKEAGRATRYYNNWVEFYTYWNGRGGLRFTFALAGYFDNRAQISLHLFFFKLYLHLPIYSKYDECDPPEYGFYLYGDGKIFSSIWFKLGRKTKSIEMPWAYTWVRTSLLCREEIKSDQYLKINCWPIYRTWWEHETPKKSESFYLERWQKLADSLDYPYTYVLKSGEEQKVNAHVTVKEWEWRPRWFKWTGIFKKIRRAIDIDFSGEVGERAGSWKGGCTGCSYDLKPGETPLECIQRMERERKFDR